MLKLSEIVNIKNIKSYYSFQAGKYVCNTCPPMELGDLDINDVDLTKTYPVQNSTGIPTKPLGISRNIRWCEVVRNEFRTDVVKEKILASK